jgi:hypothetical protein
MYKVRRPAALPALTACVSGRGCGADLSLPSPSATPPTAATKHVANASQVILLGDAEYEQSHVVTQITKVAPRYENPHPRESTPRDN